MFVICILKPTIMVDFKHVIAKFNDVNLGQIQVGSDIDTLPPTKKTYKAR